MYNVIATFMLPNKVGDYICARMSLFTLRVCVNYDCFYWGIVQI